MRLEYMESKTRGAWVGKKVDHDDGQWRYSPRERIQWREAPKKTAVVIAPNMCLKI